MSQYPGLTINATGHFTIQSYQGMYDYENYDLGIIEARPTGRRLVLIEGESQWVDMLLGDDLRARLEATAKESQK